MLQTLSVKIELAVFAKKITLINKLYVKIFIDCYTAKILIQTKVKKKIIEKKITDHFTVNILTN